MFDLARDCRVTCKGQTAGLGGGGGGGEGLLPYLGFMFMGDVPLDRVCFFGLAVLNRVYNFTCVCPKQVQNLS